MGQPTQQDESSPRTNAGEQPFNCGAGTAVGLGLPSWDKETSPVSAVLWTPWLSALSAGSHLWSRVLTEVAKGIEAADEALHPRGSGNPVSPAQLPERSASIGRAASPEERLSAQRELIRKEAYRLWLRRKASGIPGDALGDWAQAEHSFVWLDHQGVFWFWDGAAWRTAGPKP